MNVKIGFIGAGNMAQAIGLGLLDSGVSACQLIASAPSSRNLSTWQKAGINVTKDNNEVIRFAELVFLCVKPQYLKFAVESFTELPANKVYASVLAGISLENLEKVFRTVPGASDTKFKIIRMVPSTPIFVKAGYSVMSSNSNVSEAEINLVKEIMSSMGWCEIIPENQINTASAVSGSGPAFIFMVIEALADGAVLRGLPRDLALRLASRMVEGAGRLVAETGKHPGLLKDEVCSPGGTTIAGIQKLEAAAVRHAFISAVQVTGERSDALAKLVSN